MKLVFLFFILSAQAGFAATMPEDLKKLAVPFGASVEFVKTPSNSVPTDNPTDELIVSMLKEYQEEVHGKNSHLRFRKFQSLKGNGIRGLHSPSGISWRFR